MPRHDRMLGALVLATSTVLAACWPSPHQNPDRTAHNPHETELTVETVGDLTQLWDTDLGAGPVGQLWDTSVDSPVTGGPIASAGRVVVGSEGGRMVAFGLTAG